LPGIIFGTFNVILSIAAGRSGSFNELRKDYQILRKEQRIVVHKVIDRSAQLKGL